ncbi:MAG: DUF4178 domain-containing protein [bacterium]
MTERTAGCPNCGAEIVFRWSGAVQTSCPACGSVLVRHDLDLTKVGSVGDVPPSMSRIQLGTEGTYNRLPFVVVGRIIYEYERGHWSEWHIRLADSSSAWLSDAQTEYAITKQVASPGTLPPADTYRPGQPVALHGAQYSVGSVTRALYSGVEGELPFEYWDKLQVIFVDLKGTANAFATVDFSETPAMLFAGEYVTYDDLHLTNLRDESIGGGPRATSIKGLNCPQCGAAIELRTGALALSVACPSCAAILDAQDPNLAILQEHQERSGRVAPKIPLGTTGNFAGERWQAIGFQVRGIRVGGTEYNWREYLLWNAERGFRYLTEYDGHWNEVAVLKGAPSEGGGSAGVAYNGEQFKHFQSAVATTQFALGEFPWQLRTGDHVDADDYIAPPHMLSREASADEVTWSLSTYTAPQRIAEAFKLTTPLPAPHGIFANQPNPKAGVARTLLRAFSVFTLVAVALMAARFALARNDKVFTENRRYSVSSGDTAAFVTRVFALDGHTSNVEVRIDTDLSNAWAYFNLALLAEDGSVGYDVGREVSNYAGVDGGESWHEGSPHDKVVLPAVPPGKYYLRVDPERDPADVNTPFSYTLSVRRDVPRLWPFLIALLLLAVPPVLAYFRELAFEFGRWKESDHPWSTTDSGDDDE